MGSNSFRDAARLSVLIVILGLTVHAQAPKKDVPADPLAGVKVPEGYTATLFAGPPDISYPTCIAASPDGILFVGVDLNGSLGAKPQKGKVVRCIDTDNDGKADKFNTFVEVDSPRGLYFDHKTLYVLHPPFLSAFHDDNGDGVSDREEVLVKGIGFDLKFRGADHTTNGIRMGIDGWIYIAVGDYGFVKAEGKDGTTKQLRGGGIARVRPDGSGLEIVCDGLRNIYDVAVSPTLDLFTRDNTNDGGGWNVRLSHIIPTGHYGYPRLFVNFPEEIIQPLNDFGGGSPTGSIFLDEPGFPVGLYTCEWGKSGIYTHPLKPKGATYEKSEDKPWLGINRPTDIDADGSGRMYISSWKDGGFDFSKPDVGFVIRVVPKGWKYEHEAPRKTDTLIPFINKRLGAGSAVLRLDAQRNILQHPTALGVVEIDRIKAMAKDDNNLAVRITAIFTLMQTRPNPQTLSFLATLAEDLSIRESVLRALTDDPRLFQLTKGDAEPFPRRKFAEAFPWRLFTDGVRDENPRVRLQAVIGLGRSGKPELAEGLLPFVTDKDPVIAHAAINALVALKATDVCLKSLDSNDPYMHTGALRVLQSFHEPAVVDNLLSRLSKTSDSALRKGLVRTLARLYQKEADWDGKWWSTRPDTRGPYYNPVKWSESDKIYKVLQEIALKAEPAELRWLFPELQRQRVEIPELGDKLLKLAATDKDFRSMAVDAFAARTDVPPAAVPMFIEIARSVNETPTQRARALKTLIRLADTSELRDTVIEILTSDEKRPVEVDKLWDDFVRDGRHSNDVKRFVQLTIDKSPALQELAWAVLATVGDRSFGSKEARATAENTILQAWSNPASAVPLLRSIGKLNLTSYAPQIRPLIENPDKQIAAAAKASLAALRIDPKSRSLPLIGKLKPEDVPSLVLKEKGDIAAGARLFQRTGCINCHTVSPTEAPKGPMLAGVSLKYKREELLESILKPSAKLAQGFESHLFELANGKKLTGFIVKESGDQIEIRDANSVVTLVKKADIEERRTSPVSVMPDKLADNLTAPELASLLAYLESLKAKQ